MRRKADENDRSTRKHTAQGQCSKDTPDAECWISHDSHSHQESVAAVLTMAYVILILFYNCCAGGIL
jgi:hypothetical protein